MITAADLLQALLARMTGKPILERRTGLPYGWAIWIRNRSVAAAPFDDDQVTDVLLGRPAAVRVLGPVAALSMWRAFVQLWWQQWEPRPRDERPLHWLAVLGSLLVHLGFVLLLLWAVSGRLNPAKKPEPEEGRVRLSFIGDGASAEGGGEGQPAAAGDAAAAATSTSVTRPAATAQRKAPVAPATPPAQASAESAASTPTAATEQPELAPPQVPPVAVEIPPVTIDSPLQVTETQVPTSSFVVPPPPAVAIAPRPIEPTVPQVRQREVQTVTERPQLRELPQPRAAVSVRSVDAPSVREREVVVPDRPQITAQTPPRREITPTVRMPEVAVRQADVPNVPDPAPEPAPAPTPVASTQSATPAPTSTAASTSTASAAPTPAPATSQSAASTSHAATADATTAASSASRQSANSSAGPKPVAQSGGWDMAAGADDWSKADRNRTGANTGGSKARDGLFNDDGSVRVAGTAADGAKAGDRGPPGSQTDTWSRDQIAQGGTWLKRPPYDYTPTSFDKYWMPNESLLQEWVRRGLKKIEIAIPGTNTKISCVVSLLQLGGGCGLSNPNLNDQPATARPPPDVPFKRELQDNNGAVR
ncbi:transmembrane repetitive protein [Xanthomonas maliensis]|uniref:transmembrane repetitive protein n=2 Tax=Xanthomonas maliensis TaxID=1321368 RepID=UPI00126559F6|nr:transmembrane repetitive protein [Xanthomonas maliensis]KAB7762960.1 transmembrane repetitive protein [Xanthomonas maliensis]